MSPEASTLGITALWSTLVAALGLALIVRDADELRVSLRAEPEALTCEEWVRPKHQPPVLSTRLSWVRVQGCTTTGLDAGALQQVGCDAGVAWVEGPVSASLVGTSRAFREAGRQSPVLTVGEDPRRLSVLGTALLGLLLMSWAMLPWVRRWQAAAAEKSAREQVYGRHGGAREPP